MQRWTLSAVVTGALVAVTVFVPTPGMAAATRAVATWQMNEGTGASTMFDSSGNGIRGSIGSAVKTGVTYGGATGYRWTKVNPNEPPAKPERLVTVNDSRLNPGNRDYAVTLRFRTTHSHGNMIQKGQAGSSGGYWKWENVRGKVTCLFRGRDANGNVVSKAVNSGSTPLNDGAWHVLRCERLKDRLVMTIDNSRVRRALGSTGTVANTMPLSIGGKYKCDQIKVSCDYFSGDIDYIRIASS